MALGDRTVALRRRWVVELTAGDMVYNYIPLNNGPLILSHALLALHHYDVLMFENVWNPSWEERILIYGHPLIGVVVHLVKMKPLDYNTGRQAHASMAFPTSPIQLPFSY